MSSPQRCVKYVSAIDEGGKFSGPTEADTTYVGGRAENMHTKRREKVLKGGRGSAGKTPVHGVIQRATEAEPSQVRAIVLSREDGETLVGDIRRKVTPGAEVYTDEARAYEGLARTHQHEAIDHSREYVVGNVHTNGMENFWSLLKRSLGGTPTTPASECRDHIAECMGWTCPIAINADPLWEHTSGRCRRTNPIPTGLDILLCLPPGWAWQCRIARWEAYDDNDSHKVVVAPRTTNEPDDAARLVAMAWQEHAKENQ